MDRVLDFPKDDVINELLTLVRISSTIYCRSDMTAPWGFHVEPRGTASFHVVLGGGCWLEVDGLDEPLRLTTGDLVILPSGHAHQLRDDLKSDVPELEVLLS